VRLLLDRGANVFAVYPIWKYSNDEKIVHLIRDRYLELLERHPIAVSTRNRWPGLTSSACKLGIMA